MNSHILKPDSLSSKSKIHKNQNRILYTTIYRKPNDCFTFLHYDSAHRKSLKDSILFSQALRIKQICFKTSELIRHFKGLKDTFIQRSHEPKLLDDHVERTMRADRKALLQTKPVTQENIPLGVTFNKTLPSMKNIIDKH